jgi:aminoglycoside phosphotransferase
MEERITALLRRVLQTNNPQFTISRVTEGNTTPVYKILNGTDVFYLKLTEEKGEMISPQILAHEQLVKKGARIPRFVSWDDMNATLGSSYMITKEMPGIPLSKLKKIDKAKYDSCIEQVLLEAGRDLSKATSIQTKGYGWIKRDQKKTKELVGEYDSYKSFLLNNIEKKINELKNLGFDPMNEDEVERYKMLVYKHIDEEKPCLAHGDLTMDHIYVNNGRYSGIIDWGDIRSASNLYDLAHFSAFHPQESEQLLKGFKEVTRLSSNYETKLVLIRLAICINNLYWISRNRKNIFENNVLKEIILEDIKRIKAL